MWYTKVVEAKQVESGIVDQMKDPMKPSDNIKRDLENIYYYPMRWWPETGSMLDFFKTLYMKITRLSAEELITTIATLQKVIKELSRVPEEQINLIRFTNMLGKFARVVTGLETTKLSEPVQREVDEKFPIISALPLSGNAGEVNSNLANHDYLYNNKYPQLINYWNSGLVLNYSVMMTIVAGADMKSSELLKNMNGRQELKSLILQRFPFYENFDTDAHSKEEILQKIVDTLSNGTFSQEARIALSFFDIGIGSDDFMSIAKVLIDNNVNIGDHRIAMQGLSAENCMDILEYAKNNKSDYSHFGSLIQSYFINYGVWSWQTLKKYKDRILAIIESYKQEIEKNFWFEYRIKNNYENSPWSLKFCYASGIFGEDIRLGLLETFKKDQFDEFNQVFPVTPEELAKIEENKRIKKEEAEAKIKKLEEQNKLDEAERERLKLEQEEEEKKRKAERAKLFQPGSNYFIKFIENGDIEKKSLSDPSIKEDFMAVAKSLWYVDKQDSEDNKIISYLLSNIPVYVMKNSKFYDSLEPFERFNTLDAGLSSPLGFFIQRFSENNKDNTHSAIFINAWKAQDEVANESFLKNMGITPETLNRLTIAHEMAHLLHYVKMGGPAGKWNMLEVDHGPNPNKSRVYLTDMKEIIARVFGNISLMQHFLHQQVEQLTRDDRFQKACLDEMVEHLMEQEDLNFVPATDWEGGIPRDYSFMTIERINAFKDERRGPFQYGDANDAAEKKIKRQKRRLKDYFRDLAADIKREASLKLIKEIKNTQRLLGEAYKNIGDYMMEHGQVGISSPASIREKNDELQNAKKTIEEDLAKLRQKLQDIRNGALDVEYDLAIEVLSSYFALRDVQITNEIVSDPAYNPPFSIFDPEGEGNKFHGENSRPLDRQELLEIRNYDLENVDKWNERNTKSGPIALDVLSAEDYELLFPESVRQQRIPLRAIMKKFEEQGIDLSGYTREEIIQKAREMIEEETKKMSIDEIIQRGRVPQIVDEENDPEYKTAFNLRKWKK